MELLKESIGSIVSRYLPKGSRYKTAVCTALTAQSMMSDSQSQQYSRLMESPFLMIYLSDSWEWFTIVQGTV